MFEIEKGVPVKLSRTGYPFAKMEIGDSIFVSKQKINAVRNAVRTYKIRTNTEFKTAAENDGYRLWRIG